MKQKLSGISLTYPIIGFHSYRVDYNFLEGNWMGKRNKNRPWWKISRCEMCLAVQAMVRNSRVSEEKNETLPDHVETIIPLPPTWFLACCLSSLPHFALGLCHHWKCLKRPQQEDRYYHVNNCLKGHLSTQSIWLHKNTKEGNRAWAKRNRIGNLTRKNHSTSCMTFLWQ